MQLNINNNTSKIPISLEERRKMEKYRKKAELISK